jgi:hypothetical protein
MFILGPCYVVDVMDGLLACLLVVLACHTLLATLCLPHFAWLRLLGTIAARCASRAGACLYALQKTRQGVVGICWQKEDICYSSR